MISVLNQDTKEVVGFPDSTSSQEISNFFKAEKYGSIETRKVPLLEQAGQAVSNFVQEKAPSFYDSMFKPFYDKLGENLLRPNYLAPDDPGDWRRAFTTNLAESATFGIMKAPDREQLAKEHPIAATAGTFAGFAIPMAGFGAGLKATRLPRLLKAGVEILTPIAEKYPKMAKLVGLAQKAAVGSAQTGITIGAYNVVAKTAEELQTQDHFDIVKVGGEVIKDTLPWMAAGAVSGAITKPLEGLGLAGKATQITKEVAASSGSLYLIAKANGASENDARLQAGMGAIFHLVNAAGNYDAARDFEIKATKDLIKGYLKAENPNLPDAVIHRSVVEFTDQLLLEHKQATKDLGELQKRNYEQDYLKILDKANSLADTLEPMRIMANRTGRGMNEIAATEREVQRLLDEADQMQKDYHAGLKSQEIKTSVELAMERAGLIEPNDIKTNTILVKPNEEGGQKSVLVDTGEKVAVKETLTTEREVSPDAVKSEKAQGRVYERLKAEHPTILTDEVSAETMNMKKEVGKAVELVHKDTQRAYDIAVGNEVSPDFYSAAVNIALADKALQDGNTALFTKLTKQRSFEQRRRGQEIVLEKASVTDNSTAKYVKELLHERMDKLGDIVETNSNKKMSRAKRAALHIDSEVKKAEKEFSKYSKQMDLKEAQKFIDSLRCP